MGQQAKELTSSDDISLWNKILENQNQPFKTSGRWSRPGTLFTYTVSTRKDGSPGAEIFISARTKSITRATIMLAYRKVKEMKVVPGPKSIGVHGDSYLFAIFKALGVINTNQDEEA